MTLEEARSVLWLRNNHRPLGDLLDEGFLNEARLAWAAERAYDSRLKEAAGILLEWLRAAVDEVRPGVAEEDERSADADGSVPTLNFGLTVEQARATPWPFRDFRGQPMGPLVDARRLTLKDLGFAIENAWDDRIRRAAALLAAMRLRQAVEERASMDGPPKVVTGGRSFAERRQLQLTMLQGVVLGGFLGAALVAFIWTLARRTSPPSITSLHGIFTTPAGVLGGVVAIVSLAAAFGLIYVLPRLAVERLDRQIAAYRRGQQGEDRVVDAIRSSLDAQWTLFRNVVLPGRNRADIDAVLVGPPGVWALEIKNLTGEYRNVGERWERRVGADWRPHAASPSNQAQRNAARLAQFLRADGIVQWVEPAVVWANPTGLVSVENPAAPVWTSEHLGDELSNLWYRKGMDPTAQVRILDKLGALLQSCKDDADRQ